MKQKNIRTEAAMKAAFRKWKREAKKYGYSDVKFYTIHDSDRGTVEIYATDSSTDDLDVAILPLSALWTKRAPLKGITKRIKKAIRGKR